MIGEHGDVWVVGETEYPLSGEGESRVRVVTYELLGRGRSLADKLTARSLRRVELVAILLGYNILKDDVQELIYRGADKVVIIDNENLKHFLPESYVKAISFLIKKYLPDIVIASATSTGRTVMPAVATRCATGLTADCTGLDIDEKTGNLIQTRPAIGGNILATIETPNHRPQMATVRPHSNKPIDIDRTRVGEVIYEEIDSSILHDRVKRLGFSINQEDDANIQDAEIIVSGGRGFKKAENFKMVHEIAMLLNGAVGASRDAVDLGWVTYPHQVGLSGKTVSPKLYMAVGISGSVQHLAGIKTAENIVAINNDPEAQIFRIADFGIVADLFELLPILYEKLKENKRGAGG